MLRYQKWTLLTALFSTSFSIQANPVFEMNDTGIDYAGDYPRGIAPCSGSDKPGVDGVRLADKLAYQDCSVGDSAIHRASGDRIFHYQKIAADGSDVTDNNAPWSCVLDRTTGLVWEVKNTDTSDNNLNHRDDKFTWYNSNPKQNGGQIGDWNKGSASCKGYVEGKPRTYCHAEQFASRVNKRGLCGFTDWRIPTRQELSGLVHFGKFQPSIEQNYFPYTLDNFYWTQEPVPGRQLEAWSVDFEFGTTSPLRKTDLRPVRLVRGGQGIQTPYREQTKPEPINGKQICQADKIVSTAPNDRFTSLEGNLVFDNDTGLYWQRCLLGQSGENCDSGEAEALNWAEALSEQNIASGWRLPNIRELNSITESACIRPAINARVFPTPARAQIWSSSPYRFYDHYAWYWDAEDGIYIYGDRTDKRSVRLVKDAD